jgi:hypothetical protein
MIVWGGYSDNDSQGFLSDGGRYDSERDSWAPTSNVTAPTARADHTALWTGKYMVVWGGYYHQYTGGRYDPETDSWLPTSIVGVPPGREAHTAIWTGTRMIVWGGFGGGSTGGRYDPDSDTWTRTSNLLSPSSRNSHAAVLDRYSHGRLGWQLG